MSNGKNRDDQYRPTPLSPWLTARRGFSLIPFVLSCRASWHEISVFVLVGGQIGVLATSWPGASFDRTVARRHPAAYPGIRHHGTHSPDARGEGKFPGREMVAWRDDHDPPACCCLTPGFVDRYLRVPAIRCRRSRGHWRGGSLRDRIVVQTVQTRPGPLGPGTGRGDPSQGGPTIDLDASTYSRNRRYPRSHGSARTTRKCGKPGQACHARSTMIANAPNREQGPDTAARNEEYRLNGQGTDRQQPPPIQPAGWRPARHQWRPGEPAAADAQRARAICEGFLVENARCSPTR